MNQRKKGGLSPSPILLTKPNKEILYSCRKRNKRVRRRNERSRNSFFGGKLQLVTVQVSFGGSRADGSPGGFRSGSVSHREVVIVIVLHDNVQARFEKVGNFYVIGIDQIWQSQFKNLRVENRTILN